MEGTEQEELIRSFITSRLVKKEAQKDLGLEDNLLFSGIVDSLGIMHLISFLEETFRIKIGDEDILPDNFETVRTIATYLAVRQSV
jgi:acyl carrier protein